MSTTRHRRRRPWQQIGYQATAGAFLGSDAVWTIHTSNGLLHIATLALGTTAVALIFGVGSWAVSIGWHRGRQRYLVHAAAFTPLRRPLYPIGADAGGGDNPNDDVAMHYKTRADHWRNDNPRGLDAITGARPFLASAAEPVTAGAAQ